MSDSVYARDGRRIADAIAAFRSSYPASATIYDYSRTLVDVDIWRREIYSYGRHFPLFRYVPRSGRHPELFVINGDESPRSGRGWGGSRTPDHMSDTRRHVAATGAASVVIPFSALQGASIDLDSIRPVHVRDDANWTESKSASLDDLPANLRKYLGESWSSVTGPDANGLYHWEESFHRLGDCLFSATRNGKRARFLSSFDYEEPRPMYFLVQVPRGAGDTVESAIDALAPRAVWAARARDIPVYRQGDIFFVETRLTDRDLDLRGIVARARLTMMDRNARPRKGEIGYAAESAADKRARLARLSAMRRREYRRIRAEYLASTLANYQASYPWRADKRRKVRECRETIARHEDRIAQGDGWTGYAGYTAENAARGLERETVRLAEILSESRAHRRDRAAMGAKRLRTWNAADDAPLTDGNRARAAWWRAHELALDKYGAAESPTLARDHAAKVRDTLSIYGTAHTAREVCRVQGGAVYVRGKVSHRPELDPARPSWDTAPEHRPLELDRDTWYLAIRNRVPRSRA